MSLAFARFVSRLLIACLACVPFQAQAGMIGTHQTTVPAAQAQSARASLVDQLQAYGVADDLARSRVAALTDAEALDLADRVADAPAGGFTLEAAIIIFVALFLVWRFTLSDQAKAEQARKGSK